MSESLPVSAGRPGSVPLSSLRLDPENPRIPETHRTKDTAELATLLEMGFEAYPVAQSIAELGFFNAEPLIVIPNPDETDACIVVEGNRRLTALIGLAYPEIRAGFATPDRWENLAANCSISPEMAFRSLSTTRGIRLTRRSRASTSSANSAGDPSCRRGTSLLASPRVGPFKRLLT